MAGSIFANRREPIFADRHEAGRALGRRLRNLAVKPIVIALPRGGVPVAYEVAKALDAPLDIGLVGKLGAPGNSELGIGAIGEDGTVVVDRGLIEELQVTDADIGAEVERQKAELRRRSALYRGDRPPLPVDNATAILVDDGVATGVSAVVAARVLRARGARRVIAAVPVAPADAGARLAGEFDVFIALHTPGDFGGVGAWYDDFSQTTDSEVISLLGDY